MLHKFLDNRPWFEAKRFGYGNGWPIAWQGWIFLIAHTGLILGSVLLIEERNWAAIVSGAAVLLPLPLYAAKTRGGWRWRWGEDN